VPLQLLRFLVVRSPRLLLPQVLSQAPPRRTVYLLVAEEDYTEQAPEILRHQGQPLGAEVGVNQKVDMVLLGEVAA
jgi:hypothetical protein